MEVEADFKFHPIGQGCFYTGKIKKTGIADAVVNIVYDCGTLSERTNLDKAIEDFKENLPSKTLDVSWKPFNLDDDHINGENNLPNKTFKTLDVLFLSHLDDDHINGVKSLLLGITCKNVYLPYLTPFERLYVALRHNPRDTNDFDDFIKFLKSPHEYLLNIREANIEKIIYILGNSKENSNLINNEDENSFIILDNLESCDDAPAELNSLNGDGKLNRSIYTKKGNKSLLLNRIWEFYLYHESTSKANIPGFVTELNKLYDLNVDTELTQEQLAKILDNKENLAELRKIYRKIFKNLNKTGLIVQHKPFGYKTAKLDKKCPLFLFCHHSSAIKDCKLGVTLLTGDIGLNQIENSSYIQSHLKWVLIFQVPHHGSETGWDGNYLGNLGSKLKLKSKCSCMTSAVINFGYGNKYGHPKPKVLTDLVVRNFDIRFCNQFASFNYQISLRF